MIMEVPRHSGRPATATSPTSVSTVTDITSILEELSSDASAPDQFQAVFADSSSSEPEAKFTECRQQSRPFPRPVCSAKDEEIELTNHAVPDHRVCARSENTDKLQIQEASGWMASERFLQNKVKLLENKLQQYKCDSSESSHCTGVDRAAEEEFCSSCIEVLIRSSSSRASNAATRSRDSHQRLDVCCGECSAPSAVVPVSRRQLGKLRWEVFKHTLSQNDCSAVHTAEHCPACQSKLNQILRKEFVDRKTALLRQQRFQRVLEEHLYFRDSATLIADIIQSGPSPTASGEEIWQMFREKMASYSKQSES